MAAHTKMIIITSDEDIIRQFSFKKSTNTKIISLEDDHEQILSQNNNDDVINLPFLAELSKINSTADQVYKRALDTDDHSSSKPAKTSRKSIDMICAICGDKAIGYNYDVLTCASCKAFFRRNAFKNLNSLRCLSSQGQCSVAQDTRRKCQRCRLERCFNVGMRKDFILSEEEKQRRKQILEQNRTMTALAQTETSKELDQILNDMNEEEHTLNLMNDVLFDTLSIEDWLIIENVRALFLSYFKRDVTKSPSFDFTDKTTALINWSYVVHENAIIFINFFREIHEFQEFDSDDRFTLIKYNLFPIYPVIKCSYHKKNGDCHTNINSEEFAKRRQQFALCFGADDSRVSFIDLVNLLVTTTEQDPAILSLFLIILMFGQGLSMEQNEPLLKDTLQVNRAQSHYVNVLWNYLVHKWGDAEAHKRFSDLVWLVFRLQISSKSIRDFFCDQLRTSNVVDKLAPLMQTVLHIS